MMTTMRKRGVTLGQKLKRESKKESPRGFEVRSLLSFDPFSSELPPLVAETIRYLENYGLDEQGLFRVPGFQAQVKEMKEKYDRGENVNLDQARNIHTVASLLKFYLAELPEPLLTFELMDCFMLAVDVVVREDRTNHENGIEWSLIPTRSSLDLLPPGNRTLLLNLAQFLAKLEARSSVNCMSASNIATCFAPIVVRRELDPTDMASYVQESKKAERFIECLIQHTDYLFNSKKEPSRNTSTQEKPMRAEFIKEMERSTKILATNLLKKEEAKRQLIGAESKLDFSLSCSNLPKVLPTASPSSTWSAVSPRRVPPPVPQRNTVKLSQVKYAESSPQLTERRQAPKRRVPPSRANLSRESGLIRSAEATEDDEVQQLAQLILQGKMADATKLVKAKESRDIVSYEGEKNGSGQPHGHGKLVFTTGDIYTGNFVNGERTGRASMVFHNGNHYEGDFVNGMRHGWGIFTDYKGNKYEGDFFQGKRTGHGRLIFAQSNHIYEGNFMEGVPKGFGKTTFCNGDVFEGDHEADERHGFGIFQAVSGSSYQGWYSHGKREGVGYYISAKGSNYKGTFKDNLMHGFGKYQFASGDCYTGQFRNGKFQGKGIYHFGNGTQVEGIFHDGDPVESCSLEQNWIENELRLATNLRKPNYNFTLVFNASVFD